MKKDFSRLKPCILYISKSSSILEDKIDEIKQYLKDKINFDWDFKVFYGDSQIDTGELSNFFNTPSFFSERKVAVIKNIEKLPSRDLKTVTAILAETGLKDFNTVLVMTSMKARVNRDLLEEVKRIGVTKRLNLSDTDSIKKWLEGKCELDGISFTRDAARKMIENVNFDLGLLKKEYEKLYTYLLDKSDRVIDEKTVDKLVSRFYEMKIFDLVDAIGNREKNKALKAFKSVVIEKQSTIGLITLLFRMFKFMLYLKSTGGEVDNGKVEDISYINPASQKSAVRFLKLHLGHSPFILKKIQSNYTRFAKKYSSRQVIRVLDLLNNYDILIRSGQSLEYDLIIKMLNEIVEVGAY